jgi:hypothetical protein
MQETISSFPYVSNPQTTPRNVNFPPARIAYPFNPLPEALEQEIPPTAYALLGAILQCLRAGWNDPPERVLAAMIKRRSVRTVQRLQDKLVAADRLRIHHRKIGPRRNTTNVYEVPGFGAANVHAPLRGGGDKNVGEVLKADVNTNTKTKAPRPPAPALLSSQENDSLKTRLRVTEGRLAGEKETSERRLQQIHRLELQVKTQSEFFQSRIQGQDEQVEFYKGYVQRGQQISQGRQWREKKNFEAQRMAEDAKIQSRQRTPEELAQQEADTVRRVKGHLEFAALDLKASPIATVFCHRMANALGEMATGETWEGDLEELEKWLIDSEYELVIALMDATPEDLLAEFQLHAKQTIAPQNKPDPWGHRPMSAESCRKLENKIVTERLLAHYHLPRLSLLLYMAVTA